MSTKRVTKPSETVRAVTYLRKEVSAMRKELAQIKATVDATQQTSYGIQANCTSISSKTDIVKKTIDSLSTLVGHLLPIEKVQVAIDKATGIADSCPLTLDERKLLKTGNVMACINDFRLRTGLGLKQVKETVELWKNRL